MSVYMYIYVYAYDGKLGWMLFIFAVLIRILEINLFSGRKMRKSHILKSNFSSRGLIFS